jgi:hypothetical protein
MRLPNSFGQFLFGNVHTKRTKAVLSDGYSPSGCVTPVGDILLATVGWVMAISVSSGRFSVAILFEWLPMCSLFAATHPERTVALAMIGTYARRVWSEEYPWPPTEQLY